MTAQTAFSRLFRKYVDGSANAEETQKFLVMADQAARQDELAQLVDQEMLTQKQDHHLEPHEKQAILDHIYTLSGVQKQPVQVTQYRRLWPSIAAAASIILATSFGVYWLLHKQQAQQSAYYKNDIAPGHNQATLTLANGQKIILTKGLSGKLAQQGNTLIGINNQSAVAYTASRTDANGPVQYNTLSTAIGEQSPLPLVLTDGTKVWLDAESSITFPVTFTGKDRIVKITGEAYFEVAHNSAYPFKVMVKDQTVEDIGTHFNINAYADEPVIKTTLLEGSVRIAANGQQALLNPGQQAKLTNGHLSIVQVDVDEETAWKNGNFEFDNADIKTVMRQLVRWYNVNIRYDTSVPEVHYSGIVPRKSNISAVLNMLKETGHTNFKIEGRTITVIK